MYKSRYTFVALVIAAGLNTACSPTPTPSPSGGSVVLPQMQYMVIPEHNVITESLGVIVGNPPFKSQLNTPGAKRSYDNYERHHGFPIPDKQLALLFLNKGADLLESGGIIAMVQAQNFLYNEGASTFRRQFFKSWHVRELLDFISVRGLFRGGQKDPKVIVVVAEAECPPSHTKWKRARRT